MSIKAGVLEKKSRKGITHSIFSLDRGTLALWLLPLNSSQTDEADAPGLRHKRRDTLSRERRGGERPEQENPRERVSERKQGSNANNSGVSHSLTRSLDRWCVRRASLGDSERGN